MNLNVSELQYNNPISKAKLNEVLDLLEMQEADRIVDFGGGNGAVLADILARGNASGVLVDNHERSLASCRSRSGELIQAGRLAVENRDAKEYLQEQNHNSIDCAVCIASSFAFGDYLTFMKSVKPYVKDEGFVLVGEGFWNEQPNEAYLKALESDESEMLYHFQNIEEAEKLGYQYIYSNVASEDDWNQWEGIYFIEEELRVKDATDEESRKRLQSIRDFRKAQIRYGRRMMGFGLYLFSK